MQGLLEDKPLNHASEAIYDSEASVDTYPFFQPYDT
jgi:hypothetical protein